MFYHYLQNNPGGDMIVDKRDGLAPRVIIEADSADEANSRAWAIGLEFDDQDYDYERTRWHRVLDYEAEPVLALYGKPIERPADAERLSRGEDVAVHYLDGRVEWY